MTEEEMLRRALADAGLEEDLFSLVAITHEFRDLDDGEDLLARAGEDGARGWIRWRSAMLAGDRILGRGDDRGPPIAGEWLLPLDDGTGVDPAASARLVCDTGGVATRVCTIRERDLGPEDVPHNGETIALREVVHLLAEPAHRRMIRHVYWTLEPHDPGALARRFDRFAGYEERR